MPVSLYGLAIGQKSFLAKRKISGGFPSFIAPSLHVQMLISCLASIHRRVSPPEIRQFRRDDLDNTIIPSSMRAAVTNATGSEKAAPELPL